MRTCIAVMVDILHQKYLPMFILFSKVSYPEYDIKVFLYDKIQNNYRDIIDFILLYEDNIFLIDNNVPILPWFISSDEFEKYDYVYFGNIKTLICREFPTITDQHISHCENINLPYSNSVIPKSKKLTSLHFIHRRDYYNVMDDVIKDYKNKLCNGNLANKDSGEILYSMVLSADLHFPSKWFCPFHGLNLEQLDTDSIEHYQYFELVESLEEFHTIYKAIKLSEIAQIKTLVNNLKHRKGVICAR